MAVTSAAGKSKGLSIAYGGNSSAGVKPLNEDAFAVLQPEAHIRAFKGAVACIADGASCSAYAQEASQTSVTTFIEDYFSTPDTWDVKTSAARVLSSLNSWLYHQGQVSLARHNGLVTTFSSIIFKSTSAHILHTGDSRIYRYRNNELIQLSRDHSLIQKNGETTLTRALGMDSHLEVDYLQKNVKPADLMLLSTDGVHNYLQHNEMLALLEPLSSADYFSEEGLNELLEETAKNIVDAAKNAGSDDNLTCLLVKVIDLPHEDIDEIHRKLTKLIIPPVLEPGVTLDEYKIIRVIHNGARSHIYLAEHPRFREPMVIKVPSQRFAEDPEYLEGFIREQWVGRRIDNPGVMKIFDPLPNSKFLYHVCEYIPGQTLRQWMHDNPQANLIVVRDMTRQISSCLRVLQRMGMLHRDLKPENIILTSSGQMKLIDFGTVQVSGLQEISSVLSDETPVGTADYIAPEYLMGERGVTRSDIFSLGVIVYEILTGHLPYVAPSAYTNQVDSYNHWQYTSALNWRKDIPLWVDLTLKKACAPKPSARYQALSEFLHDLDEPNQLMLSAHQSTPLMERNPLRFWQAISATLLVLLILSWMIPAL